MAEAEGVTARFASERKDADAALEALLRFGQSAKEFLQYQPIYAEGAQAKKLLVQKEAEYRDKDNRIKELDSAIRVWSHKGHDEVTRLEIERANLDAQLRQVREEKANVEAQATETKRLLEERTVALTRLRKDNSGLQGREEKLKADLKHERVANKELAERLNTKRIELESYTTYLSHLTDLDLARFAKGATKVWNRTVALVEKYFSLDISPESLEKHDRWVQQACSILQPVSGNICIPPTNTAAAQFARKAVMRGILAHLFVQYVFRATPAQLAHAGLDAILSELTAQDERKELLCRAILGSVIDGSQSEHTELLRLTKDIFEIFGCLLSSKPRTEMKAEVKKVMTEALDWWAPTRRSYGKVSATVQFDLYQEAFKTYPTPHHQRDYKTEDTEASDPEDLEEVEYVQFPAFFVTENGKSQLVQSGYCIRDSQLLQAKIEWQNDRRNRSFHRTGNPGNLAGLLPFLSTKGALLTSDSEAR